jgi:hypothetical protein
MARKKHHKRLSRSAYASAVCASCSTLKSGGRKKRKRKKTKHKKSR